MKTSRLSVGGMLRGATVGLLAIILAGLGMMAFGYVTGQATVAEGIAEAVAGITPISLIELMVIRYGAAAKHALFFGTLGGMALAGILLGGIAGARRWTAGRVVSVTLAVSAILGVLLIAAVATGIYGAVNVGYGASLMISLAITAGIYIGIFLAVSGRVLGIDEAGEGFEESRRVLLEKTALGVAAIVTGGAFFRWLTDAVGKPVVIAAQEVGPPAPAMDPSRNDALVQALTNGVAGVSPEVTSNDKFYYVSKNVIRDPNVNDGSWRLQVKGRVDHPMTLTYQDLKNLPSFTQYLTLQCISNEIGGDLMSNARWRGVALSDILARAGVQVGAVDVILRSADDYTDSIPIDKALQPDTMLAYEMNDQPLPQGHGFPVRLLVPDIYGMKNAKWLTEIEVVEYDFKGYWQNRGWSDIATMNTTSRIDVPRNNASLRTGSNYIGGVAVAGQRGIQSVEVSTDGGQTWNPAAIKPPLGQDTWVLWLYQWDIPDGTSGDRRIAVRATDGNGVPQDSTRRDTLPNGATGYHSISVQVG